MGIVEFLCILYLWYFWFRILGSLINNRRRNKVNLSFKFILEEMKLISYRFLFFILSY